MIHDRKRSKPKPKGHTSLGYPVCCPPFFWTGRNPGQLLRPICKLEGLYVDLVSREVRQRSGRSLSKGPAIERAKRIYESLLFEETYISVAKALGEASPGFLNYVLRYKNGPAFYEIEWTFPRGRWQPVRSLIDMLWQRAATCLETARELALLFTAADVPCVLVHLLFRDGTQRSGHALVGILLRDLGWENIIRAGDEVLWAVQSGDLAMIESTGFALLAGAVAGEDRSWRSLNGGFLSFDQALHHGRELLVNAGHYGTQFDFAYPAHAMLQSRSSCPKCPLQSQ